VKKRWGLRADCERFQPAESIRLAKMKVRKKRVLHKSEWVKDGLEGICFPVSPGFGLFSLEQRVDALEYPVGYSVFRPDDYAGSMPFEDPGQLDDLWNTAGVGILTITESYWRRFKYFGLCCACGKPNFKISA